MLARRQTERPTTGPTTAPNNNWHHAPWRTPRRDRNRERRGRKSEAQLWPGQAPPGLLLPSYSLSFSFYRVPNYVWMERPRAKISRQWRFLPLPTRSTIRKRWHPRGECARAKGMKEGRRNRLPACPLSQIGQKHDDKCGIEYRSSCLTSFGEVGVLGRRRRGYGCQVAGRPKARLCRVGLQPQLGHTSMVSLRVGEQE